MSGRTEGANVEQETSASARSTQSFPFRAATFGNVTVALAPDRGRSADRRADYHDPTLPPRHALLAFGLWMQKSLGIHAIVHVGARFVYHILYLANKDTLRSLTWFVAIFSAFGIFFQAF